MTTDLVEKLREAYRAWSESCGTDPSVWLALFADDIVYRSVADGASGMSFSGPRRGIRAVQGYFTAVAADWEMLYFSADEIFGAGDRVTVIGRCGWRFRATGKAVESPTAHIWKFRDGKIVEYLDFYDTAGALAATVPD
ncbi:Hypothetical protein A7982_01875 [Minicystis rosea]|nr:Hypothetical protein A7982_01875 [Minicystis rosea]